MKPNGSAPHVTETYAPENAQRALLSVEEVAALLKVPPSWVYDRTRMRTKERIPGFRLGKYWRFREADVLAWLERQRGTN
jgi:excisionase family DNA binding protein